METGQIQSVDINKEMKTAYIDYAMSVIVARALPDVRDGLKPVHRRILYAMHDMGIRASSGYKKSARIVGEVLGKYHPHGDQAVYEAMARDFSLRYMLVDGQGNFGSVDGDSPAAMRYTEARMAKLAEELLVDIDKETVDFIDNFDASLQEPSVMPARLPNLLLNGTSGIAVGMATNIPPHNLGELIGAIDYIIENYDHYDDITVEDLMKFLTGPDFPTGGILLGAENIRQAYSTGRGRLVVRGVANIEERSNGRFAILITEIPYQVNKSALIERIAALVRSGKIDGISDLRDESDRSGMSIVVELKRGAQPKKILNMLYKYTTLQSTFGMRLLALVNGEPRVLSLKRALQHYIEHRKEVIERRSEYELRKAKHRAHVLDGYMIALANLDDVIKTIRESPDVEQAKERLMTRFRLSDIQAQAILDMQLRRLAALERMKIEDEHKEIMAKIAYLEDLLSSPRKVLSIIQVDLKEIKEKFGDERRTRIAPDVSEDFSEEDLVVDEPVLISITEKGYIKRVSTKAYRTLGRGRKGVTGQNVKDEDEIMTMIHARTLHTVLFFSDQGKVYSEKVYQIPEANRTAKGVPIVNVLAVSSGENITAIVSVVDFKDSNFCTLATERGRIKRVKVSEFSHVRPSGLIAINLEDGDKLGWVRMTSGQDDIILVTRKGQALRMVESAVRSMGRQAAGVRGIRLRKDDLVASLEVVEPNGYLLVVTENGYGKRSDLKVYSPKGRATGGVRTINPEHLPVLGPVVAARVVQDDDEITFISSAGIVLRLKVKSIRPSGRATRGVRLMDMGAGDTIASLARIEPHIPDKETSDEKDDNKEEEKDQ
ncbi:MAG: DNA gyrase subunit A [Anaerolineaceae bacterium]|nr:DNA gyrase subunit A [Anaerolineaceae bacterium]